MANVLTRSLLLVFSKHQGWRQWASSGKIVQVRELTEIAFENWNN